MSKKANSAEIEKRSRQVLELILKGYITNEILEYCRINFKVAKDGAIAYIKKARDYIKEETKKDTEILLQEAVSRYMNLFKIAYETNNLCECRKIQERLDKIMQLERNIIDLNGRFAVEDFEKLYKAWLK